MLIMYIRKTTNATKFKVYTKHGIINLKSDKFPTVLKITNEIDMEEALKKVLE